MRKFWRSVAECLVASLANDPLDIVAILASLTVICYRLHVNIAAAGLLFVIVIVIISRVGSFVSSVFAAIIAALCLAHIAPPAFSFEVISFLVTSFVIAGLVSRVRKQAEDALSSVGYRVIEAEEQERQRIASDLHEDIGQRLTLLVLEVEQLKTDTPNPIADVPSGVDAVLQKSSEILTDVKALAHELYSPRLEYLGIAGVMSSFCIDFGKRKGVEIDFRSDGLPSRVPQDTTLCLFRVLQEALHNAVKYSGVRQFDARLWGTSDEIHLTVSDCGVGFGLETARKAEGLGLNRMQERLKLVKGRLSIESQPKRGTTIHALVPVSSGTDSMRSTG
jgi:signal transduction histidine kinase